MIHRAASDLKLDLSQAYVIGDQSRDIELARQVGARGILVLSGQTGREVIEAVPPSATTPDYSADGLPEAVEWIFGDVKGRRVIK